MGRRHIIQTPVRFIPAIGGVENHVYYLSKELVKKGFSVTVICANEPVSDKTDINHIKVIRLPYICKITNTNICLGLSGKLLKTPFDIINTHMPTPWSADWSIFIAKLKRKKSILTIHNDMDKQGRLGKLITKIYLYTVFKLSLYLANKIIIVNPTWEKTFLATRAILKKHKNKITVIPNGIDLNLFPMVKAKRIPHTILFVSILDKHHGFKGLQYLLEAMVIIKKHIPDVRLMIVGEGELKQTYKKTAVHLDIDKHTQFIGEVPQSQLASFYQQASVFVLPSTEIEGFGIVLLEAMACGLPVVSTDIVGTSDDIKKYKTGLVVKPFDVQALADAIIYFLENQDKARTYGQAGRKLIEEKYGWPTIANQVIKIYNELLL